jgi:cytidylate kinase
LDGRDIGTVIVPRAQAKLFVTATAEKRAERRYLELTKKGFDTTYETVLNDIRMRDARDAGRSESPLRPADDAVLIDTTNLSIDQAIAEAIRTVDAKRS